MALYCTLYLDVQAKTDKKAVLLSLEFISLVIFLVKTCIPSLLAQCSVLFSWLHQLSKLILFK